MSLIHGRSPRRIVFAILLVSVWTPLRPAHAAGEWPSRTLADGTPLRVPDGVSGVAISADGRWVATSSFAKRVYVWRFGDGRLWKVIPCASQRPSVAFTPNSRTLAIEVAPGEIGLFDPSSGRAIRSIDGQGPFRVSTDGVTLIGQLADGAPAVWQLPSGKLVYAYASPKTASQPGSPAERPSLSGSGQITTAAVSVLPDGRRTLSLVRRSAGRHVVRSGDEVIGQTSYEEILELRNLSGGPPLRSWSLGTRVVDEHGSADLSVSMDSEGHQLLFRPGTGAFFHLDFRKEAAPRALRSVAMKKAAIFPDGRKLLAWDRDTISVIDLAGDRPIWTEKAPAGSSFLVPTISSDGKRVTVAVQASGAMVLDASSGHRLFESAGAIADVAANRTGDRIVLCERYSCSFRDLATIPHRSGVTPRARGGN